MDLTKEQIELGAMYFAASNTGLVGLTFPEPKSKSEIRSNYSRISYEYENELGEGLEEELAMWKKGMKKEKQWAEKLKERAPYVFE
jgi:hypothetical protein